MQLWGVSPLASSGRGQGTWDRRQGLGLWLRLQAQLGSASSALLWVPDWRSPHPSCVESLGVRGDEGGQEKLLYKFLKSYRKVNFKKKNLKDQAEGMLPCPPLLRSGGLAAGTLR